jgi:general secretion pathway protein D
MLLRMNGATMVKEEGVYKIVPQAAAVRGNVTPQLGNTQRPLPPGYSVQIVPLRYVGTREMLRVLEPFAKDAQALRVDDLRNLLILSGTERELRHLLQTIEMFDVDWMAGMSVGLFTLQSADVKSVMADITRALGDPATSPLTGILRIIPIERLNAILVITPQPAYIDEAKKWVERLDRAGGESGGVRFYVYNLQYQHADKIGPLLQQAFTGRASQQAPSAAPSVAPGTPAGTIVSPPSFQGGTQVTPPQQPTPQAQTPPGSPAAAAIAAARAAAAGGDGSGVVRNLQVVADKDNNTLLIVATPAEYGIIEQALKKLDVPQRQVLMEVTMAEVTLHDALSMGVEALFRKAWPAERGSGGSFNVTNAFNTAVTGTNGLGVPSSANFTYLISNPASAGGIQAILSLMDSYGNTRVLANPQLAALDNQKATIKVGDRIPICQQTIVGNVSNAVTTTSQYIDTGTLFQVTPHINASGVVTLDVQAEVSIPGVTQNPCDAPPINTRSVQTLLAVPTGQTMVLGGLIRDSRVGTTQGFPLLSRIPVLGGLFGSQSMDINRVELVIFITPRVIEGDSGAAEIIEDLRRRMERLDFAFPATAGTVPLTGMEKAKRAFDELYPVFTPMQRGNFGNPVPADAPATAPSAAPAPAAPYPAPPPVRP